MMLGRAVITSLLAVTLGACSGSDDLPPDPPGSLDLTRTWRSADVPGCAIASPLLVHSQTDDVLVTALTSGLIVGTSPTDGHEIFRISLPAPVGDTITMAATPGQLGQLLVIAFMIVDAQGRRIAHEAAVIDLDARALDPRFPIATLDAVEVAQDGVGMVPFSAANSYSRSAIPTVKPLGMTIGLAYVAMGNIQDIQPWHGWVFELDLDAWSAVVDPRPVSAVLLTTPESDCGPPGESGSDEMICGGGVWSPPGPLLYAHDGVFDLYVATGNGQLDLGRRDYADTIMRTGRGLTFDPACNATACASFDPIDPSPTCMASCDNLFIPRYAAGDPPFDPPDGRCDGKTFFECYALLDWDLGANTPARVAVPGGPDVLVIPAKDGGVYMSDVDHMGTMLDRLQVTGICGGSGSSCGANWAGTMVTQPVATVVDGTPVVIIPTFVFDNTTPAGLVALDLTRDVGGAPHFAIRWRAPNMTSAEATERFREHTGRVALGTLAGEDVVTIVDPGDDNSKDGLLYVVRVTDGAILERAHLDGPGRKYTLPVMQGDSVYAASCDKEAGPSHLEGWLASVAP